MTLWTSSQIFAVDPVKLVALVPPGGQLSSLCCIAATSQIHRPTGIEMWGASWRGSASCFLTALVVK